MKTTIAATLAFAALARPAIAADAVAIAPLSPEARTAMTGKSWRQGCPVSLDDLAVVKVIFIGFDGADHSGTIVVHKQLAPEVADIFNELRAAKFPIAMHFIKVAYGSDDGYPDRPYAATSLNYRSKE